MRVYIDFRNLIYELRPLQTSALVTFNSTNSSIYQLLCLRSGSHLPKKLVLFENDEKDT